MNTLFWGICLSLLVCYVQSCWWHHSHKSTRCFQNSTTEPVMNVTMTNSSVIFTTTTFPLTEDQKTIPEVTVTILSVETTLVTSTSSSTSTSLTTSSSTSISPTETKSASPILWLLIVCGILGIIVGTLLIIIIIMVLQHWRRNAQRQAIIHQHRNHNAVISEAAPNVYITIPNRS